MNNFQKHIFPFAVLVTSICGLAFSWADLRVDQLVISGSGISIAFLLYRKPSLAIKLAWAWVLLQFPVLFYIPDFPNSGIANMEKYWMPWQWFNYNLFQTIWPNPYFGLQLIPVGYVLLLNRHMNIKEEVKGVEVIIKAKKPDGTVKDIRIAGNPLHPVVLASQGTWLFVALDKPFQFPGIWADGLLLKPKTGNQFLPKEMTVSQCRALPQDDDHPQPGQQHDPKQFPIIGPVLTLLHTDQPVKL